MTKRSGIGSLMLVDGYNLAGDTQAVQLSVSQALLDATGINAGAHERIAGLRDGMLSLPTFFNPAEDRQHEVLSTLPSTARLGLFTIGSTLGTARGAGIRGLQDAYSANRAADGALTFQGQLQGEGFALDLGELLTAGIRTDTTATNGASVDYAAATSFGWAAHLQVTAFTGTSATITIQDSADNSSFAGFTGSAFAAVSAVGAQRIEASAADATVRRYVRVATSGTFSDLKFVVLFMKYQALTL